MGATQREVFIIILGEALLLGLCGTLLGLALGIWLGSGLVSLVTRSINDLYYTVAVNIFYIAPLSLAKAVGLGLCATLLAAYLPAREAASAHPSHALSRAQLEARWQTIRPKLSLLGLSMMTLGGVCIGLSTSLWVGFVGLFLLVTGCAALIPALVTPHHTSACRAQPKLFACDGLTRYFTTSQSHRYRYCCSNRRIFSDGRYRGND